jgi:hypothetical protein
LLSQRWRVLQGVTTPPAKIGDCATMAASVRAASREVSDRAEKGATPASAAPFRS